MQLSDHITDELKALLDTAIGLGISIRAEDGALRLHGDVKRLTANQIALLREHKSALLACLPAWDERLQVPSPQSDPAMAPAPGSQRRHLARTARGHGTVVTRVAFLREDCRPERLDEEVRRWTGLYPVLREAEFESLPYSGGWETDAIAQWAEQRAVQGAAALRVFLLTHADGQAIALAAQREVADAASLRLLMGRLRSVDGAVPPPQGAPFGAFALAEQRMLAHPHNQLRARRAAGALGAPAGPAQRHYRCGGSRGVPLDPSAMADLSRFTAELGVTPLAWAMAALEFAGARSASAEAVLFSIPHANRSVRAFMATVGPLACDIALAVPMADGQSLAQRAGQLQQLLSFAHDHQDLALDTQPLLPGSHAVHVSMADDDSGDEMDGAAWPGDTPLALTVRMAADGPAAVCRFDAGVIPAGRIDGWLDHFAFLMNHARQVRACQVADLPVDAALRASFLLARRSDPDVIAASVCAIFSAVLERPHVAPDDNFFELAGNSLSVAKVVTRIKREYEVAISFSDVFRHPTPAALAGLIAASGHNGGPELKPLAPLTEMPASPQQVRYFASYNIDCTASPRMTLMHGEWDDAGCFAQALQHLVQRHELLRTGYFMKDGVLTQRILATAEAECEQVHAVDAAPAARRRALEAAVRARPFALGAPPLMRAAICERAEGGIYSVVAVFNGILDAYSEGVMEDELRDAYELAASGTLARRPPLVLQYQDFTRWQNELAATPAKAAAQRYWEEQYPLDYPEFHLPDPERTPRKGEMRIFVLGEALSARVKRAASACESSLFGFLLANFFQLAASVYRRDDVSVGLLYHGRENEEMQRLVGYFVDALCLRCDIEPGQAFPQLVRRVNDTLFRAIDARSYQFQDLAARFGRSPSDPVFPVCGFHVNNVIVPGREKQVPADFVSQVLPLPYAPKFDFNIYVHESNRGILIRMAYASSLVDTAEAERIASRFVALVESSTAGEARA